MPSIIFFLNWQKTKPLEGANGGYGGKINLCLPIHTVGMTQFGFSLLKRYKESRFWETLGQMREDHNTKKIGGHCCVDAPKTPTPI